MGRSFTAVQRDLARNLRLARKRAGLSQEALALNADVDRTYVSQIERGVGNPSVRVVTKLSQCLGIDLSELMKAN